ncbi:unnamed protein product [Adineta ricciae]|uniref:Uncharacterized protein n=1 Tax=Adineta ricciae TaxID=249248 RepID=A0A815SNG8_ADIRI|nr:unnamed protein product [Adineta ricciae]CAF1596392.1 unnamed protein product [Adineta ricciae]
MSTGKSHERRKLPLKTINVSEILNEDRTGEAHQTLNSQQNDLIRLLAPSNRQTSSVGKDHSCQQSDDESYSSRSDIDQNNESEDDILLNSFPRSTDALGVNHQVKLNKRKRNETVPSTNKLKQQRANAIHNGDNPQRLVSTNLSVSHETNTKEILSQIENQIVIYKNMVDKTLKRMERKLDHHLGISNIQGSKILDQYRTDKNEVFPSEYKYQDKNLLITSAKDMLDFARKTLRIIFSADELKSHILPPEREHLRRPALDEARFNVFLGKFS